MKLYKIKGKIYEVRKKDSDINVSACEECVLYETGIRRNCPSVDILYECTRLGWNVFFVEYNGIVDKQEVIELISEKKVYSRMHKGFTRRDVLRELILEMKEKYGVDIVRKCNSVDQCKSVIEEIIRITCNNELNSAKDLVAKKEKELDDVKNELNKTLATNKRMNGIINSRDSELFKLINKHDTLKKELDTTEKSRIEWVKTAKDNVKLYNDKVTEIEKLKSEYDELRVRYQFDLSTCKEELRRFKADNKLLRMWLREAEDRGVRSLIVFKAKRLFNKLFGNGYDK